MTEHILSSVISNKALGQKFDDILPWSSMTRAERLILVLRYYENFTLKQIGTTIDFSESHISRLLSKTLDRLYSHVENYTDLIYPFSSELEKRDILQIREFSSELITYLSKHPDYLYKMKPRDFERLIAHLLETVGFDVELTVAARDGGYDIVAFNSDRIGIKSKYIVECKRYHPDSPVGVQLVRSLYGLKDVNKAQHAILATTSYFTRDAMLFAANPSVLGLHLKDMNDILTWLERV